MLRSPAHYTAWKTAFYWILFLRSTEDPPTPPEHIITEHVRMHIQIYAEIQSGCKPSAISQPNSKSLTFATLAQAGFERTNSWCSCCCLSIVGLDNPNDRCWSLTPALADCGHSCKCNAAWRRTWRTTVVSDAAATAGMNFLFVLRFDIMWNYSSTSQLLMTILYACSDRWVDRCRSASFAVFPFKAHAYN